MRADYRLRAAERALTLPAGAPRHALTEWELDRGWERLDKRLAREGVLRPVSRRAAWAAFAGVLALAAALALVPRVAEFAPRGAPPPEKRAGIRAFAVAPAGAVREGRRGPLVLRPGERLFVSASNPGEEAMWLTLLARAGERRALPVGAPEQVPPRSVDEVVNGDRAPALRAVRASRLALEAVFTPGKPNAQALDALAAWPPGAVEGAVRDAVHIEMGGAP